MVVHDGVHHLFLSRQSAKPSVYGNSFLFANPFDCNINSGVTNMVYPGAVHSRFEHSLGVYWLAGKAVQTLKNYQVGRTSSPFMILESKLPGFFRFSAMNQIS